MIVTFIFCIVCKMRMGNCGKPSFRAKKSDTKRILPAMDTEQNCQLKGNLHVAKMDVAQFGLLYRQKEDINWKKSCIQHKKR